MEAEREDPKLYEGIPRGHWVALSTDGKRVMAHSPELMDAIREANRLGEADPLVTRVPEFENRIWFL